MQKTKVAAICVALIAGQMAVADGHLDREALIDFMAGQGCVVGPASTEAARAAGFDADKIDALGALGERIGANWVLLPQSLCQMRFPSIQSDISMDDPEVLAAISEFDEFAAFGDPGCYLNGGEIYEAVQQTRGWDADMADQEYIRFIGAGITQGALRFYSEDILRTPPGFQVMTGECGKASNASAIRVSYIQMRDIFDSFVRESAMHVDCEDDTSVISPFSEEIAHRLTDGANRNAWLGFEVQFIAMGAGWAHGGNPIDPGTPTPPMCRYK